MFEDNEQAIACISVINDEINRPLEAIPWFLFSLGT